MCVFRRTIKYHYLIHVGRLASWLNPRSAWIYPGEDFTHRVKGLRQTCHSGTHPALVQPKVVKK
eukprot:9240271-Alexandrium_andersonii.AAC.1